MSPNHKRTAATILFASLSMPMQHLIFFPQRPRNFAQLPSILYSMKCSTGQCYASSNFFFIRTLNMLSERLFELVSEPSGSSRWKYQDPPLVIFHPEHHVIIFFSRNFFFAITIHSSYLCKLTMVPNLLDYRIGILHYLFCTY